MATVCSALVTSPAGAQQEGAGQGADARDQAPTTDDAPTGDQPEPEPADPMANEAQGEEAPATDITVPPKKTYHGQDPFEPAEILWSSVAAAKRKLEEAERSRREVIIEARSLRRRGKELALRRQDLDVETTATIDELARTTDRLKTRAVYGYQWFGSGSEAESDSDALTFGVERAPDRGSETDPSDYQAVVGLQRRSKMIDSALRIDQADIDRLDRLRAALNGDAGVLLDRARLVADYQAEAEAAALDLQHEIDQAGIEYEAFRAGSEIFIHGVVFPLAGTYPTPLIDSYGFPRMPGTPDEHWHEGIDIFATRGTPLVAAERGVITKVGVGRLGGLKFWLKGESGSEWYYAHLDSFAPELVNGAVFEAGQLVGYVGTTGNAVGTPPHLHLQLHPDGDRPVNPYPLLKVVSDLERAAMASGEPLFDQYQPVVVDRPEPAPEPPSTTIATSSTTVTAPPTSAAVPTAPPPTEPSMAPSAGEAPPTILVEGTAQIGQSASGSP